MRKPADNFVSPAAQLMNPDGSFTDLMFKLMYDQPIKGIPGPYPSRSIYADLTLPVNGKDLHEVEHDVKQSVAGGPAVKVMPIMNDEHHDPLQHTLGSSQPLSGDAKAALDIHNNKRHQHGCPALAWNAGLASKAEEWAKHLAGTEKMEHSLGSERPE
jgi:hypothetical protein